MFLQRADRLALVDFKNRHINYTELINNIKYFSEYVVNLEKDRFGLIIMENRPEWIYGFMAIWDKNSAGIALDANSNPQEILYVLNDANPDIILCSDQTQKNIIDAVNQYEFKNKITVFYTTFIKENIIKKYENKKIWDLEIISKYINSSIEGYFLEEIFENKGVDKDFENRAKIAIKEIARFIDSALK